MRPTPEEVIAGVRHILKHEVATVLPEDAQSQLKRVMAVLRDARWDDVAFDLMNENESFSSLARDAAARLACEPTLGHLCEALEAASTFEIPRSFIEANAINRQLRSALSSLVERIRDERLMALDDLCTNIVAEMVAQRAAK